MPRPDKTAQPNYLSVPTKAISGEIPAVLYNRVKQYSKKTGIIMKVLLKNSLEEFLSRAEAENG